MQNRDAAKRSGSHGAPLHGTIIQSPRNRQARAIYNRRLNLTSDSSLREHALEQAGCWFLRSGIQEPSGGVARYFLADAGRNKPVSTEITGYAASAFSYLYSVTG